MACLQFSFCRRTHCFDIGDDLCHGGFRPEVTELRREGRDLKECVAELTLENRLLKKSMIGDGELEE